MLLVIAVERPGNLKDKIKKENFYKENNKTQKNSGKKKGAQVNFLFVIFVHALGFILSVAASLDKPKCLTCFVSSFRLSRTTTRSDLIFSSLVM